MASDNFAVASNPLAAPWASAGGSPAWAALRAVSGECATASGSDGDCAMRYASSSSVRSIVEYRSGTFDGGPAFLDASGNGYLSTCFSGTTVNIFKVTAGANYTQLGTDAPVTFAAGDLAELRLVGNDVVFYKNGVAVFTQTDSTFRAGLNPAIFIFAGNLRLDNWSDGLIDLLTGLPLFMRPGPGVPIHRQLYFMPQPFAATNMLADTSLQATLASGSALIADLTAIGKTGMQLRSGPGISPDYMYLFRAQVGSAVAPVNDTSLAATLSSTSTLTAALTTAITPAATLASVSALTAQLTTAIPLAASLSSTSSLTAALSTAIPLQATLASVSTLTAALSTAIPLQATLASVSTLTAQLSTAIPLAASLASVSTFSGTLTTAIRLQAALASVSTLQATLDGTSAALQASLSSVSTLTAALSTAIPLQATFASASTLTAQLTTAIRLQAALSSVSSMSGTLTGSATALQATLASVSMLSAQLTTAIRPTATLVSVSTLTASLSGTAAALQAQLSSVSALIAELGERARMQPSGPGLYDPVEGQIASRRVPFVSMSSPGPGTLVAAESYGVAIARFAWAAADGRVRTVYTGDAQRLGWVRQVFGPRRGIYVDRGLRWIRPGLPVTLYTRGEFWARFAGGALAGDTVYVSLLDGSPISGYAIDALPTPWRVAMSTFPGELTVITTWE